MKTAGSSESQGIPAKYSLHSLSNFSPQAFTECFVQTRGEAGGLKERALGHRAWWRLRAAEGNWVTPAEAQRRSRKRQPLGWGRTASREPRLRLVLTKGWLARPTKGWSKSGRIYRNPESFQALTGFLSRGCLWVMEGKSGQGPVAALAPWVQAHNASWKLKAGQWFLSKFAPA